MMDIRQRIQTELAGSFAIQRELGGGGMSRVFLAEEASLGRSVVIKVLAPELAETISAERFGREVRLAARLQHPQIVPVLSAGEAAGLPWYTMPYVQGESLRSRIDPNHPMPVGQAVSIIRDVAKALDYAHGEGVVHRDIKPENILLSRSSAAVTDFGIAKALSESREEGPGGTLTQLGMSLGTPAYMAPEQVAADPGVDHRADIYSLGVVGYELLAGVAPFHDRSPQQMLAAHLGEAPVPLQRRRRDVPPALATLLMRCLAKDPAARPQSAADVLAGLEAALEGAPPPDTRSRLARIAMFAALALIAGIGTFLAGRQSRPPAEPPSIAVLPLRNLGTDAEDAWFADGMTDELTVALQQLPGLRVASRNAVLSLADGLPADSIGERLGVRSLLTGTVRRDGGRIRLTAELIGVPAGEVLWSERYERSASDVFAVQDDITRSIVGALQVQLTPGAAPAALRGTADLEAYDLYLRGRTQFQARGVVAMRRAAGNFGRAVARDPQFARAWAGLAMVQSQLPYWTDAPVDSILPLARAAAQRAIALDSTLAEPWAVLGFVHRYEWDWPSSEAAFRRALGIDARSVSALQWYGEVLLGLGRSEDALAVVRRAHEADPHDVTALATYGYALVFVGRQQEGLELTRRAAAMDPTHGVARFTLATALHAGGRVRDAADEAEAAARLIPSVATAAVAAHYRALAGEPAAARALLAELERAPGTRQDVHLGATILHLALRADDAALRSLERAVEARETAVIALSLASPMFDPLRHRREFLALARRAGVDPVVSRPLVPRSD